MGPRINSAYRIYKIFENNLTAQNEGLQNVEVWSKIFGINESDHLQKSFRVLEKMTLLKKEMENSAYMMSNVDISKDTYAKVFESLKNVLNPQLLYHQWNTVTQQMKPDIMNVLKICSELLPDEEDLITEEEILSIINEIESLEGHIDESEYSDVLKSFVKEQLSLIKTAISNYKIQGAKAFNQSYYDAHTVLFKNAEVFKDKDSKTILKKIGSIWNNVLSIYERVSKTYNMLSAGIKLLGVGDSVIDKLNDIIK
jgi:hypothetical protein